MLNLEDFREEYPEFNGPFITLIEKKLASAALQIDPNVWGLKTNLGHGLLTAHLLCLSSFGKTAKMVAKDGHTTYGDLYMKLVKTVSGKARPIL